MKKKIIVIIIFIALIGGATYFYIDSQAKQVNGNNQKKQEHVLTLDNTDSDPCFLYHKLEIDTNQKKIRLYYTKQRDSYSIVSIAVNIYNGQEKELETIIINNPLGQMENSNYFEAEYKNNLIEAASYNAEIIVAKAG